ncbi:MAG TPA: hypothetical protein VJ552_07020 [Sediminibacterium sp.]|nr:hypothetical protein [Sediminibacterium sp.]
MQKSILSTGLVCFFALYTSAQTVRPVNNPATGNGALINAREVGDPSLSMGKNPSGSTPVKGSNTPLRNDPGGSGQAYGSGFQLSAFTPATHFTDHIVLSEVSHIKLIDLRSDPTKVGYMPLNISLKRKGIQAVGVQIQRSPFKWLSENFLNTHVATDSNSKRQLVLVLKKCWFSQNATAPYQSGDAALITTLEYSFDLFSSVDYGYYPQRKISGSVSAPYNKGNAYNVLLDSLLTILQHSAFNNQYAEKETSANRIAPADFNEYYNAHKQQIAATATAPRGIYLSYDDFLKGRPFSDTVEVIHQYDNSGKAAVYACELTAIKNSIPQSCNKAWGYYDGTSLFLNTGNGFYIRLLRAGYNYVFFNLNNIREDRIKSGTLADIQIGKSSYEIIKEYSRVTPLTYQLDMETGTLY